MQNAIKRARQLQSVRDRLKRSKERKAERFFFFFFTHPGARRRRTKESVSAPYRHRRRPRPLRGCSPRRTQSLLKGRGLSPRCGVAGNPSHVCAHVYTHAHTHIGMRRKNGAGLVKQKNGADLVKKKNGAGLVQRGRQRARRSRSSRPPLSVPHRHRRRPVRV